MANNKQQTTNKQTTIQTTNQNEADETRGNIINITNQSIKQTTNQHEADETGGNGGSLDADRDQGAVCSQHRHLQVTFSLLLKYICTHLKEY